MLSSHKVVKSLRILYAVLNCLHRYKISRLRFVKKPYNCLFILNNYYYNTLIVLLPKS